MVTFLIAFHIFICILLTIVVLLQFGKGAEAGAIMGQGASQSVFTSNAKGNFFTKLTTVLAIIFVINSVSLTIIQSKNSKSSLLDSEAPVAAPLNSDQVQDLEATTGTEAKTPAEPSDASTSNDKTQGSTESKKAE